MFGQTFHIKSRIFVRNVFSPETYQKVGALFVRLAGHPMDQFEHKLPKKRRKKFT
jgi:hypothetical protein